MPALVERLLHPLSADSDWRPEDIRYFQRRRNVAVSCTFVYIVLVTLAFGWAAGDAPFEPLSGVGFLEMGALLAGGFISFGYCERLYHRVDTMRPDEPRPDESRPR